MKKKSNTPLEDFHNKYEDLVWYARKPGNFKLSTILNDDLSVKFPKKPEAFMKKVKGKLGPDDNAWEKAYELCKKDFVDLPFEVWAHPGEEMSGMGKFWPEAEYRPDIVKGVLTAMKKVEKKYPDECAALNAPEKDLNGDWQHGFNSGCLATIRYAQNTLDGEEEINFPDTNT